MVGSTVCVFFWFNLDFRTGGEYIFGYFDSTAVEFDEESVIGMRFNG